MERRWNRRKSDVPDYSKDNLNICREALMEAVAETSEEFMERYFNGEEFSEDEIRQALRVNVADGSIVPVLMGSNTLARGMYTLLVDIVKYLPSPEKRSAYPVSMQRRMKCTVQIMILQNQSQLMYGRRS